MKKRQRSRQLALLVNTTSGYDREGKHMMNKISDFVEIVLHPLINGN